MAWEVEFADEFGEWWDGLDAAEQKSVDFSVTLLSEAGPALKMPHSSGVEYRGTGTCVSSESSMRGVRTEFFMRSIRAARQSLLIGGDKTGNDRWYEEYVPQGDQIYDQHLKELEDE